MEKSLLPQDSNWCLFSWWDNAGTDSHMSQHCILGERCYYLSQHCSYSLFSFTALHLTGMIGKKRKREDVQESETPDSKKAKIKTKTPHTVPKVKRVSVGRLLTSRRGVVAYWTNSVLGFFVGFFLLGGAHRNYLYFLSLSQALESCLEKPR